MFAANFKGINLQTLTMFTKQTSNYNNHNINYDDNNDNNNSTNNDNDNNDGDDFEMKSEPVHQSIIDSIEDDGDVQTPKHLKQQ